VFEIIKKAMFMGVGLATLSKEKLAELGKEVAAKAELSEKQAAEFTTELEKRAEQARSDFESEIDRRMQSTIKRLGLVPATELSKLVARIEELTSRIEKLEAGPHPRT
jgi:polyhydroxyalkanoate synthesis regulator phasin